MSNIIGYLGILVIASNHASAEVPAATVTQTFDKSTHSLSLTGTGTTAKAGTTLSDGEFLKTGKTALAELVLANKTVTRLGPSTVFNYSAASHEANLQSGTILFSKPKDGKELTIKMSGVSAAVTGTTGFVEKDEHGVVFGVIEGTVHVTVGTATAILKAGNMLVAVGSKAQVVSFDVPDFVKTSAFFHSFQGALPNEKSVEHELAQYDNLVARGFIAPVKAMLASTSNGHDSGAPNRGGRDSTGNSAANPAGANGQPVTLANGNSSYAANNANGSFSGSVTTVIGSGSSSLALNSSSTFGKTGTGATILGGANSYTGGTTVNGGTLVVGSAGGGSGATLTSVGGGTTTLGGTLAVNGGGNYGAGVTLGATTTTIGGGSLRIVGGSGVGTINTGSTLTGSLGGGGTLSLGGSGLSGGTISGGILNLNGSTLTLGSGTTTFSGVTGVSNGTLVNNGGTPITIGGVTVPPHGSVTVH